MSTSKPWGPACTVAYSHVKKTRQPKDLVSICVTNFNYSQFLPDCLNSLAAQTHNNLDLVIVDDQSTDGKSVTVATDWLEANAERFYRATTLVHCRNQGPSEARNTAFRNALSEYVFIIDADNEAYPRAVARLYAAATDGPFDATYPQLEIFGDRKAVGSADIWDPEAVRENNYVDVMGIVRKSAWQAVGGYSHIDEGWEDYDFWLKFVDAGFSPGYVPEILCRYRVHGRSRTATEAHVAHEQLKLIMAFRHPPKDPDVKAHLPAPAKKGRAVKGRGRAAG
jgi:glycosyltransferase involved in cell wall biosynthesis